MSGAVAPQDPGGAIFMASFLQVLLNGYWELVQPVMVPAVSMRLRDQMIDPTGSELGHFCKRFCSLSETAEADSEV
jgi:hypothetical protein